MSRTAAGPGRAAAALAALLALVLAGAGCRQPQAPEPAAPPQVTGGGDPARFRVLVFTRTAGFRHRSISDGVAAIRRLGRGHGFAVDDSADPARIGRGLTGYRAVVFLSPTGDLLDADQRAALRRYLQGGGGWVGVHAAADAEYDWPWYGGLVGAWFRHHPPVQRATVRPAPGAAALTGKLPPRWERTDEWYDFAANPRGRVRVLATVDESTYTGGEMGTDHPIAWCHEYDGGRNWYSAMGHTSESFQEPRFLAHVLAGIRYAAGQTATRCDPRLLGRNTVPCPGQAGCLAADSGGGGLSLSVGSVGWGSGQPTIRPAGQPPAALMDGPMMGPAQQGQIGQVGRAAMQPVAQMMGLAPAQRPGTVGEDTAAVTHRQSGALGGLDDPAGPADLQRLGRGPPRTGGSRAMAARSCSPIPMAVPPLGLGWRPRSG